VRRLITSRQAVPAEDYEEGYHNYEPMTQDHGLCNGHELRTQDEDHRQWTYRDGPQVSG
jgi:hypothetical protein